MEKKYEISDETLKEVRCWDIKGLTLRVTRKEDGALPKIEGYAALFNSNSEDMGFVERIKAGAFKNALKISDARALFNHDPNYILGRQSNGTLVLKEDKKGLFMSVQPPDTQLVRDMVLSPIERGDITQQSFGFTIESDEWEGLDSDTPVRTITKVKELFDVSPVTYPAYQDTSVALRSLEAAKKEPEPTFSEPIIKITFGEDTSEFSINDTEGIDRYFESLRSEAKPTLPTSDNADDAPTSDKSPDIDDGIMERISNTLKKYEVE